MSEMIERVARVLAKSSFSCPFEQLAPHYQQSYREDARSAIEAMREPTGKMCVAGNGASSHVYGAHCDTMQELAEARMFPAWQAMIDEALKCP